MNQRASAPLAVSNEFFFGYAISQGQKTCSLQLVKSEIKNKRQNLYRVAGFHLKWLIWNNVEPHSFTKYLRLTVVFM